MMPTTFRCRLALVFLLFTATLCADTAQEVIGKARNYLGDTQVLDAVQSVQYRGTLTTDKGSKVAIEIIFQKPRQHRVTVSSAETIEITALDDFEAWERVQDVKDPGRWKMSLMRGEQIRRLQANTQENLSFFSLKNFKGDFIDAGLVDLEGHQVRKLTYKHSSTIRFTRYIDPETGRLLLTETENGGTIREEGEIRSGGIRFPKKMTVVSLMKDGTKRTVEIEFDTVAVNEKFAESLFAIPMMTR